MDWSEHIDYDRFFAAHLTGGSLNSFIYQYVPVSSGDNFEFLFSLSKIGISSSPPVTAIVDYYDDAFNFLGDVVIVEIPAGDIPDDDWLEEYQTTTPVPLGTTQALVLINSLPEAGSADLVVDDVRVPRCLGNDNQ